MEKNYSVGSEIEGVINSTNEYAIYIKLNDLDIDGFLHCNDLSYTGNPEEELAKYKKGDKLKVKILEIKNRSTKSKSWFKTNSKRSF